MPDMLTSCASKSTVRPGDNNPTIECALSAGQWWCDNVWRNA